MDTWLKGQRHEGDRAFMTNTTYFDGEKKRINKLLSKCKVVVLCDPDSHSHLYGYIAYAVIDDIFIVHYAHLKKPYRRLGLMSALITELCPYFKKDEIAITHINAFVAGKRMKYRLKFNPFMQELI
jgi:hypothetical protein